MSWLEKLTRPKPHPSHQQTTTIILHRIDSDEPIVHHLRGLWSFQALPGVLEPLVQEYYDECFDTTCEIVYQNGEEIWEEELALDLNIRYH